MTFSEASEILAACNYTELYQTCRNLGLPVHQGMARETLVRLLVDDTGTFAIPQEEVVLEHPLDPWRLALMAFVEDYWDRIRAQLQCPARSRDPRSCFQCTDAQVVYCLVENECEAHAIHSHYVRLRKKTP